MHVTLMFPNEYLSAADLRGKDVTLTVSRIERENLRVEKGTEQKWVIHFREMEERKKRDPSKIEKKLVLNKTNAKSIAKVWGGESNDWLGKPITLYPTTCQAFGETVDCIRVRQQKPKKKRTKQLDPEPPPEQFDDEHEFDPDDLSDIEDPEAA